MLDNKYCEACSKEVEGTRNEYPQTKFCEECALQKKREKNSGSSWPIEQRRDYMREYMRVRRRKVRLVQFLDQLEGLAVRITGAVGLMLICLYIIWHHISQMLK